MISFNFDSKVDRAFKILVFTKLKEIRTSKNVHVKQMIMGRRLSKIFVSFYKDKFCYDLTYLLQYDILQHYVTYLLQYGIL